MSRFLSEKLSKLVPYTPGEQPQDKKYIKLNTNESPFKPSKMVLDALSNQENELLNLYSDPTSKMLIESIAKFYKVDNENVFVGNGSDEVLAFIFYGFCDEKVGMACPEIGYSFYPVYCDLFKSGYKAIELNEDFSIDIGRFKGLKQNITIANPNAQTGLYLSINDVKTLLLENSNRLVVIDEAYCDFGGESAVSLLKDFDNLIVVSTLSKSRQLAGARIGFCIASKEIIKDLNTIKYSFNPYNLNRLSIIAGAKAFDDVEYFDYTRNQIIKNRIWFKTQLENIGFKVTDSLANFVLVSYENLSGNELYLSLKDKGILVRFLSDEKLKDWVRITIGSEEQMQTLVETIKAILKEKNI